MPVEKSGAYPPISSLEIMAQTERILSHRNFAHSSVFQRFLRFIVRETLEGRTIKLKEYTIAREVLDKPEHFNAQEDCIVRVHAMRLRKALDRFYDEPSLNCGEIRISIPKGQYAPIFFRLNETGAVDHEQPDDQEQAHPEIWSVAPSFLISPFHYSGKNTAITEFADGLATELNFTLGEVDWCSVLSNSLIRSKAKNEVILEPTYTISGELHCQGNKIRVSVELSRNRDLRHIWGGIFEYPWSSGTSFRLQDELVVKIMEKITQFAGAGALPNQSGKLIAIS